MVACVIQRQANVKWVVSLVTRDLCAIQVIFKLVIKLPNKKVHSLEKFHEVKLLNIMIRNY